MSLRITPETKVGALLEAFPELEEVLVRLVPAFSKLRNPILRRTVAKVATLEQAAKVGGISVRELVSTLRSAIGQDDGEEILEGAALTANSNAEVAGRKIRFEIDADAMLEGGEHPIGKVRQSVEQLDPGEMVRLTSSFRPAPLIEHFRQAGCHVYVLDSAPGRFETCIWRRN